MHRQEGSPPGKFSFSFLSLATKASSNLSDYMLTELLPRSTKGKIKSETDVGSSRRREHADDMDVDCENDDPMEDVPEREPHDDDSPNEGDEDAHDDEDDEEDRRQGANDGGNRPPGAEEAFAMFDFGRLGGYMSQVSSRLRTLLNDIKPTADPTTRLIALQELSEVLSISTEDSLAGSFQVESFVRELVRILGGTGEATHDDDDDGDGDEDESALAAALAMSAGGAPAGDENLEAQLLACRCLANLMEALPGVGHTLVYHGAIPVLCSKLLEISFIDLAEQTLLVRILPFVFAFMFEKKIIY